MGFQPIQVANCCCASGHGREMTKVQRVKIAALADPAALLDKFAVRQARSVRQGRQLRQPMRANTPTSSRKPGAELLDVTMMPCAFYPAIGGLQQRLSARA